ncbi:MAG: PorP/SprF family type IX secretion system membrane protein [Bacteroidetes bacterium]|nr:PorP/SprF family type IX secretion system membrane protein [Bacteroidota bacterium]
MKGIAIIAIILVWHVTAAQDLAFSQYFNAPVYTNPAFAGVDDGPRFSLNYRNEWASLGNAYLSYAAAYDQNFEGIGGGIGAILVSDRQAGGLYVTNSFTGVYSYQINLNRYYAVRASAQAGLVQHRIATDELVFAENINPDNGSVISNGSTDLPDQPNKTFADFGAGFLLYSQKFFMGMSAKHLTSPNESLLSSQISPLPICWSANLGWEFHSDPHKPSIVYFTPNFLYVQQAKFKQLTGGAILGVSLIYGGMYYRTTFTNGDALILQVGLKRGVFKMGYSYDATVSQLKGKSGGTHELALVLNFHDSEKIQNRRHSKSVSKCPEIF